MTSNGFIEATVKLITDRTINEGAHTTLLMQTSNGYVRRYPSYHLFAFTFPSRYIHSHLSLVSRNTTGGRYEVDALTSNGAVDIAYIVAPLGSTLIHNSRTTNARANVSLHPAYEGSFRFQCSNDLPLIDHRDTEDPVGHSSRRGLSLVDNGFIGEVHRGGNGDDANGVVAIKTSNALALLCLREHMQCALL